MNNRSSVYEADLVFHLCKDSQCTVRTFDLNKTNSQKRLLIVSPFMITFSQQMTKYLGPQEVPMVS